MSHRIPLGIGGITGFRAASAVARLNCHFWQEYCHFWQEDYLFWQDYCHFANIFCLFWRFAQKNFGFHRVSRISEGFRGFHRVSSAESASRHSSAGYVFEALARWRAESVGWNTYSMCVCVPCTSPVGSDPHPVTTPNDAYLLPCGLPHHPTKVVWEAPLQNTCIAGVTEGEALGACHGDEATRCYAHNGATQGGVHGRVHACAQRRERTR